MIELRDPGVTTDVFVELRVGRFSLSAGMTWFAPSVNPEAVKTGEAPATAVRLTVPKYCKASLEVEANTLLSKYSYNGPNHMYTLSSSDQTLAMKLHDGATITGSAAHPLVAPLLFTSPESSCGVAFHAAKTFSR